ncbi:MAG TPA: presqualene diphosphate synthase HpnD [Streptosporangiaceae bacterium]|jgi:phytoene synthase
MTAQAADQAAVLAAYQHCEQVTRTQARNFSYGIRLLPEAKRRALSAVYAFARRIDDIGDGDLPPADKLARLGEARAAVAALAADGAGAAGADQVLLALADAAARFPIPLSAFTDLIDGCEADVRGTSYGTFDELEGYCRCVAGSIGRLSLGVFGSADMTTAVPLADSLGVALQLTNILRDIREDLGNGRVYLPLSDQQRFGCTLAGQDPDRLRDSAQLQQLVRFEAERARQWYAIGMRLMPLLDRRSAASAGAMAGIYRRLLEHIDAAPQEALGRRLSLSVGQKALVAAGCLAGMARRPDSRPAAGRTAGSASSSAGERP